jgi:hypothetical protein
MTEISAAVDRASRHTEAVSDLELQRALRWFRYAAVFYLLTFVLHTADHVRRGVSMITVQLGVLAGVAAVLQVLAVVAALSMRWRWAPLAAVLIAFPGAVGIVMVHFLPHWSAFSDAFPGAQGTGVTGLSWFSASLEVVGALAFGTTGAYAYRRLYLSDQCG